MPDNNSRDRFYPLKCELEWALNAGHINQETYSKTYVLGLESVQNKSLDPHLAIKLGLIPRNKELSDALKNAMADNISFAPKAFTISFAILNIRRSFLERKILEGDLQEKLNEKFQEINQHFERSLGQSNSLQYVPGITDERLLECAKQLCLYKKNEVQKKKEGKETEEKDRYKYSTISGSYDPKTRVEIEPFDSQPTVSGSEEGTSSDTTKVVLEASSSEASFKVKVDWNTLKKEGKPFDEELQYYDANIRPLLKQRFHDAYGVINQKIIGMYLSMFIYFLRLNPKKIPHSLMKIFQKHYFVQLKKSKFPYHKLLQSGLQHID